MKMIVTMPAPNGVPLDEAAAARLEGQWVTVLAFGQRVMGRVSVADPIPKAYGVPYMGVVIIIDPYATMVPPHTFQEYNQFGNACQFPGCTLSREDHRGTE